MLIMYVLTLSVESGSELYYHFDSEYNTRNDCLLVKIKLKFDHNKLIIMVCKNQKSRASLGDERCTNEDEPKK